ncbi:hypothetical protein COLO4_17607 [Corchorus olitorius]|uniref:malate dehydrogenase n=1 Tax=Corchorus olitorius TaxID=93759 RepID=A0A1R3JCA1_9ROSI|nr:hypothetical protein COLO4_17607 [Corchorus olitorius]
MIPSGIYSLRGFRLPQKPIFPSLLRCRKTLVTTSSSVSVSKKKEKVIVISGPTGAGKSRLALELAKRLNGEIISADSVQVYRGLDVGSAKPSPSDRKEVPHHLIDILHPSQGKQQEMYLTVVVFPLLRVEPDCICDDVPKASLEIAAKVYSELADFEREDDWEAAVQYVVNAGDPKAQSLASNDWYRLRRSLEIIRSSGSPPSAFQVPYDSFRHQPDSSEAIDSHDLKSSADAPEQEPVKELDYDFICFFLSSPRLDLYRLIDMRCEHMLSETDGILSEARWLLDTGLLPNSNSATRAIGYRQAMEYLLRCREKGGMSSSRDFYYFLSEFQKASRNFAKRQLTWFRNEHIYHWLNASRPLEKVLDCIYDAYKDESGNLYVPEFLQMKKDVSNRKEASELKAYRTRNRHFVHREDCSDILDWIRRTQGSAAGKHLLRRGYATESVPDRKVAVLGAAGGIGQPLALLMKLNPLVSRLALYDIANTPGVAADVSHINTRSEVEGFVGEDQLGKALEGSDVVIIPAGVPRKPGMTRDDLFNINAGIVKGLCEAIAKYCPHALVNMISNPVNSTVPIAAEVFKKAGTYDEKKLFGVTTLDVVRAKTFYAGKAKVPVADVNVPVVGGHAGITILPLFSQATPAANLPEDVVVALTKRTQDGGTEVVEAKAGKGSATLSMAYAGAIFADACLKGLNGVPDVVECSFVQSTVTELPFFASKVKLGKNGVEEVLGLGSLSDFEKEGLEKLKPELKSSIEKGIKFANQS